MKNGNLIARVERLEAQRQTTTQRVHRIVSSGPETDKLAMSRYEQETGVTIASEDLIIRRILVDSPSGDVQ